MSSPLSDAEWKIMQVMWRVGSGPVRAVLTELEAETGWAYTTVKTMLDRLVDKGVLAARMKDGTRIYRPVMSQAGARSRAARSLMDKAFDGAFGPMMHFLLESEELSMADRAELIRMLREPRTGKD